MTVFLIVVGAAMVAVVALYIAAVVVLAKIMGRIGRLR
jgi:hypothetical protein